jgi:hypothetical protein
VFARYARAWHGSTAMPDESTPHILEELAFRVHAAAGGRKVHLILENEENAAQML